MSQYFLGTNYWSFVWKTLLGNESEVSLLEKLILVDLGTEMRGIRAFQQGIHLIECLPSIRFSVKSFLLVLRGQGDLTCSCVCVRTMIPKNRITMSGFQSCISLKCVNVRIAQVILDSLQSSIPKILI